MGQDCFRPQAAVEALSVAAVVLSLILVGLEVNESTRATLSATAAETTATVAEFYTSLGSDQQVGSMMRRYITDPHSLTLEERFHAFERPLSNTKRVIEDQTNQLLPFFWTPRTAATGR